MSRRRYYPALDGLRAVAVLMVFCHHYLHLPLSLEWGWAGVDFFFVLSGFLITGILYDTRDALHRFRNFYIRRTLRIFPLYYAVFVVILLSVPWLHWNWHPGMYLWPLYLGNYARYFYFGGYQINHRIVDTLLSGSDPLHAHFLIFNHFWSLCVEEQFYLFWPMVVFGIRDRVKLRNICIVVVIVALLLRLASLFVLPAALIQADFLYRFTPLRIDALLIGALIALCLRGPEAKRAASLGGPLALVLIIVFTAVECTLAVTHSNLSARVSQPWVSTFGFTLIDCFAGCVLLWLVTSQTRVSSLLASTVPRALGQVSYGFYVFHELLHGVYHDLVELALGPHAKHLEAWTAFIAFFATVCLAKLSFRYFEQPFIRLKFNLTGQISR